MHCVAAPIVRAMSLTATSCAAGVWNAGKRRWAGFSARSCGEDELPRPPWPAAGDERAADSGPAVSARHERLEQLGLEGRRAADRGLGAGLGLSMREARSSHCHGSRDDPECRGHRSDRPKVSKAFVRGHCCIVRVRSLSLSPRRLPVRVHWVLLRRAHRPAPPRAQGVHPRARCIVRYSDHGRSARDGHRAAHA